MKASLNPKQEKIIKGIPELESLTRVYIVLDRLITRLKKDPNSIEKLIALNKDVERLTSTLYRGILISILELNPEKIKPILEFKNPELNETNFNMFLHCYISAKMKMPFENIKETQQKVFEHIKDLVETIRKYRTNYHVTQSTKLILEMMQKREKEEAKI